MITFVNTYSRFTFIERSKNKTVKVFVEVLDALEEEIIDVRKILNYRSSLEVLEEQLKSKNINTELKNQNI